MTTITFSLIPFESSLHESIAHLEMTGTIARQSNQLTLNYTLQGDLATVKIPAPATTPTRTKSLWEHTCFEFFLAEQGSDRYWEFNLSPSSDWNIYQLDGYRQELREALEFTSLPFTIQHHPQELSLQLTVNLESLVSPTAILDLAVTAVIQFVNDEVSYWALTHVGPEADFHRRESFAIALEPTEREIVMDSLTQDIDI
jgi:hypothetical protein